MSTKTFQSKVLNYVDALAANADALLHGEKTKKLTRIHFNVVTGKEGNAAKPIAQCGFLRETNKALKGLGISTVADFSGVAVQKVADALGGNTNQFQAVLNVLEANGGSVMRSMRKQR